MADEIARRPKARSHRKVGLLIVASAAVLLIVLMVVQSNIWGSQPASQTSPQKAAQGATSHAPLPQPAPKGLTIPSDFTLQQKIGQLLMLGVSDKTVAADLEKTYQIGGFLLRSNANLFDKAATDEVKQAGALPPLIAIDQEGGYVSRLPNPAFRDYSARYLGTLPDGTVQRIAAEMGQNMAGDGANVDFAPVVDLDDGRNAAISYWHRSFSSDPAVAAQKANAFAAGLRSAGIVPTFKHFPGLGYATGPTNGDTDAGPATSPPLEVLEHRDLLPYETLLKTSDIGAVMVGNQIVPGLTNGLPASLSTSAYTLLRQQYGFKQVVFTDEIGAAKAVASVESTSGQAVVDALKAGADMPVINITGEQEVADIISTVVQAVQSGRLSPQRIADATGRIMLLKTWVASHQ